MRITNTMIQRGALEAIQLNLQGIARSQTEAATGRRLLQASDDPTAAAEAMTARAGLRALAQYRRAIDFADQRASEEETVLKDLSDTLVRAKELAISQGNDSASASTRKAVLGEAEQLLRHAVRLANTSFGDGFLFAGISQGSAPYGIVEGPPLDYVSTQPRGEQKVAISSRQEVVTNRPGGVVFDDSGALRALQRFAERLESGTAEEIRQSIGEFDDAFTRVQELVGDVGARVNQLRIARSNLDAMAQHLTAFRSDMEEVEIERAMTDLAGRQTAYQAAMLAISRVMGLTLAHYLS